MLAGRVDVGIRKLFELIHWVNPTGQELPARDAARLYSQKSGLQSLLIRRFGDQLTVKEDEREGIVSLEHDSGTRDACHAVLDELDADARAWARRQLDTGVVPGPAVDDGDREPRREVHQAGDDRLGLDDDLADAEESELLAIARRELDEFDYPAAERHLRLAFEKSRGSVEAAAPLLELLVGVMGMDRQAIELEPRLATSATTDPEVRISLALAAARLGDSEHAQRLAGGIEIPQAAEVYAALASGAIHDRRPEAARKHLDRASRCDPTYPRFASLEQEINELLAEVSRPAEHALEQRLLESGPLAVEDQARSLLAQWPDSEIARRVLREAAARRRRSEIKRHLELAEGALAEERFHDATIQFQAALDAGSKRADLPEMIEHTRELERQRQRQGRVDAVIEKFEQGATKAALLAYLALPRNLRDRVRQRVERPEIDWLEEIGPTSSKTRAKEAVAAVLEFKNMRQRRRSVDDPAILDALEPHQELLNGVAAARSWLRDIHSRLAEARRAKAEQMLDEARGAYQATDLERAEQLLDRLAGEHLSSRDRARAQRLRQQLLHAQERRLLEREYQRHLAANDPMGALDRARQLREQADGAEGQMRWQSAVQDLRNRLRREWQLEETIAPLSLDDPYDLHPRGVPYESPPFWLDDEGRELVLVEAWDHWLFIHAIDLTTRTVSDRVSLRTPEPMGRLLQEVYREGEHLHVVGEHGHLLEIGRDGWQILRWRSLRELLPEEAIIEHIRLVPGSPFVWLAFRPSPADRWRCNVVDRRTWRIIRKLAGDFVQPILSSPPRVLLTPYDEGSKIYSARGKPGPEVRLPFATRVLSAAASPDGSGLCLVTTDAHEETEEQDEVLDLRPGAAGDLEIHSRFRVADMEPDGVLQLAVLKELEIGFLRFVNLENGNELLAFDGSGDRWRPLYRSPIPRGTVLVQDRHARHAVAVSFGRGSFAFTRLGPEPLPTLTPSTTSPHGGLPSLRTPFFCGYPTDDQLVAAVDALVGEMRRSSPDAVERRLQHLEGELFGTRVAVCHARRRHAPDDPRWEEIARELCAERPEDPASALLAAEAAAGKDRWEEVVQRLSTVDPEGLDDGRGCHFHHLLGVAYLHLDRLDEATATLERGRQYELGSCPLEPLLALARPMSETPEPAEWGPEQPLARQLLGAVRIADRGLERGDLEAAREALERPQIRRANELQSAARLTEIYLRTPIDDRSADAVARRFRKRLACARFLHLQNAETMLRVGLDLAGVAWEKSRLEDLERRARAWLSEPPGDSSSATSTC